MVNPWSSHCGKRRFASAADFIATIPLWGLFEIRSTTLKRKFYLWQVASENPGINSSAASYRDFRPTLSCTIPPDSYNLMKNIPITVVQPAKSHEPWKKFLIQKNLKKN
jgi:hypothetical protein